MQKYNIYKCGGHGSLPEAPNSPIMASSEVDALSHWAEDMFQGYGYSKEEAIALAFGHYYAEGA